MATKSRGRIESPPDDLEIRVSGNTFGGVIQPNASFMTAKHLLHIAGHRAVPDCVKPAGGGGFAQLFFEAAGCGGGAVAAIQLIWLDSRNWRGDKASFHATGRYGGGGDGKP